MKKILSYITALLLATTALVSCSAGDFVVNADAPPASDMVTDERAIIISGIVSDITADTPLEGISVFVRLYLQDNPEAAPIFSDEAYTDNNGIFIVRTGGSYEPILCVLTIEDSEDIYESQTRQIMISWDSTSFDYESNTFVMNDCNFQLNKKAE